MYIFKFKNKLLRLIGIITEVFHLKYILLKSEYQCTRFTVNSIVWKGLVTTFIVY